MKKSLAVILVILLVLCAGAAVVLGLRMHAANSSVAALSAERDQLNASSQALATEQETADRENAEREKAQQSNGEK